MVLLNTVQKDRNKDVDKTKNHNRRAWWRRFYANLQLDPAVLRPKIDNAKDRKTKHYYVGVLITRDILLVTFAIVFVGTLSMLFGQKNSALAVVLFCMLMSIRFVNFGYKASHSILTLAVVLLVLLISPSVMQAVHPLWGLLINFVSIMIILLTTTDRPEMGNAGLYMFGYAFLTGNSYITLTDGGVQFNTFEFRQRALMTLVGFVILSTVLIMKHRKKNRDRSLLDVLKAFDIHSDKAQWQLQIAICMSLLFCLDMILHYEFNIDIIRFMWVGFACSSMVTAWPPEINAKFKDRAVGVIIGSILYAGVAYLIPDSMLWLLGPASGLMLGLTGNYRTKTIANCFGGLMMATTIYGVKESVEVRIINNIAGLILGALFFYAFQWLFTHIRRYLKQHNVR